MNCCFWPERKLFAENYFLGRRTPGGEPSSALPAISTRINTSPNNSMLATADVMGKNKGASRALTQEEIWDDSALVQSWDEAVEEYKVCYLHGT
jgi:hypothetical protein